MHAILKGKNNKQNSEARYSLIYETTNQQKGIDMTEDDKAALSQKSVLLI